ncbi:MAG: DUF2330 domain-containing protein [Myxococcales bacterium]|nr:DUF2330 domain-containing protein [Myxococcales bacterium]
MILRRLAPLALASLSLTAVAAAPRPAAACGGTFCDAGPQSMSVDQSGETILFVMEDGWVEAHVQIDYQGDPAQFAWIVPVMAQPEIGVGSQRFVQAALDATVPTFTVTTRFEGDCSRPLDGIGCAADMAFAGSIEDGGDFEDDPGQPSVLAQDVAGAYEYAVLEGGTVDGIGQWLDDNGYARDDQAPEILQSYLDEGFLFVAFKLRPGAGVDQIHPVVLRYPGTEPCIPLRLTRIAAVDDMQIRALFLGRERVVPANYRHVELNPARFDWIGLGANYDELVREAVDAPGADGRAFVTEYAGISSVIDASAVMGPWDSEAYAAANARDLTGILERQELIACGDLGPDGDLDPGCGLAHPMLLPLLEAYFPPPPGADPEDFYLCTSCEAEVDESAWDPAGFMAAFEERIVGPGEHALDVLRSNPYLTRLYTMMSPGEMTTDPLFHERPDLPGVSNQWTATRVNHCEHNDRFELDDGTTIYLDDGGQQPELTETSAALRVEEIPLAGAPMVLLDASQSDELAAWNATFGPSQGCECRASARHTRGAGWLGLLALLGLRARSRRRAPAR